MSNPATIPVPLASTGLVARVTYELDLLFGDKKPTDASETITYASGGTKFSHVVNEDGTVDYTAISATIGDTDTATLSDDSETVESELTVAANTAIGAEYEGVVYVQAAPAAPASGSTTASGATA